MESLHVLDVSNSKTSALGYTYFPTAQASGFL